MNPMLVTARIYIVISHSALIYFPHGQQFTTTSAFLRFYLFLFFSNFNLFGSQKLFDKTSSNL